ncbi:NirD/YgiW/YdeI family stress tolerance protein, partial [Salmonella enterica]|uniref:NirD/YgiW/YdeI family stress tolerance protein n=1 Tax=Salmonella enterica TaxID=28901 RepID=UPI000AE47617
LIDHKGDDRYVFRDKSGEIHVIIPTSVFDGREVQPDQMININGSLDKKAKEPLVRVNRLQKKRALTGNLQVSHTGHA